MHSTADLLSLPITNHTWIFFLVLLIILLTPMLLNKLKIPHIIGMILAGVLIGEHGLNLLVRDDSFELFGQVGLLYIMFLAGLELDMDGMIKNRSKSIIFGLLTFLIPFVITIVCCMYVIDYSFWVSTLIGAIFGAHTLLAYTIVGRYGQTKHPSVVISIGGTVIALFVSLIVLAGIAGHFSPEDGFSYWLKFIGKFIVYMGIVIYGFPRLTKWFFERYEDNILQYIYILALLFLSAALAEIAGLEGIFGAFMAGLVINPMIPHLSPLMNRIEFVGNALFIPYFLIGVGMMINLRLLFVDPATLWVIIFLVIIATGTKWLAAWAGQKLFRFNSASRMMFFGMTNAHAACALAMLLVGTHIEVAPGQMLIGDNILNAMIILILVSSIISSLATENAARRLALADQSKAGINRGTEEQRILIAYSNPQTVEPLTQLAILLHQPNDRKELIGLHVSSDTSKDPRKRLTAKHILDKATKMAAAVDIPMSTLNRVSTNIITGVVHTTTEFNASDILIGLHQKSKMSDRFWGNFTDNLLSRVPRQIMVVRPVNTINNISQIVVFVPAQAQFEHGFSKWIDRLVSISEQLSSKVRMYLVEETKNSIELYLKKTHPDFKPSFHLFTKWSELYNREGIIKENELMVIISARKGSLSYDSSFEEIPEQIDRYLKKASLIILYPEQFGLAENYTSFIDPMHHL
ncbi:MAG: cation:proton antiporter [Bacteroidaceae bacterium]